MWTKRKKEKHVHGFDSASPDGGATMEASSEAALETKDFVFPHPGGYGVMMMPLRVFESGIFSGRLWKSRVTFVYSKGGGDSTGHRYASSSKQTGLPREHLDHVQIERNPSQQHQLCSGNPARVDEVVEEAHRARVVEQALREEVHSLHTNKELMAETHRAQLEKLRQELEADARESRLRLETKLEKNHEISLNILRKTMGSETNRLREDLAHARQEATRSISRSSGRNVNGFGRFWKSFEVFGPSGTPQEVPDSKSVELVDGITAYPFAALTTLVPPALFVLVTVPLFCLLSNRRRQRMIAFNVHGGNNGDEIEAPGVEVKSGERLAGLDKIEGDEENRPLVQDGQEDEVQGGNDRRCSLESSPCRIVLRPSIELEAARSTGKASAAENLTALSSQHAQNILEVHIRQSAVLASETLLKRRSLQQDSSVSADGVGNGTLAGFTEFPLGARETENTEVKPCEDGTISVGKRLLTSSSTSSLKRLTPATKVGHQPQEGVQSLRSKPVVCSPPRRLYAERHSIPALTDEANRGDGSIARVNCSPYLTQSPVSRRRSLSTPEGRGVLESLRRERDSLANTCGRLDAEREVLSIRLRESAENVMKLEQTSDALEKEKSCLMKRCVVLEKEIKACGKEGRCTGVSMDRDDRVMELEKRVSERERERDETAALVAEKETRLASLTTKVKELQEALATTSATAAAAAADSTHFFSAAAALATAETQAAEMAADATQALANKEEEAQELRRRVRAVEEEKQMFRNNLEIAEAEKESCENLAKDLQERIADQETELKQLMVELETERKASAAAAAASSSEPREEALLFESHSKLAALDSVSVTAAADLEEAKCQLQRLQVENVEQQTLFDSKVSDLAVAASRILMLEDSATLYLARQRELEDEVKGLREETERLESARDELQAEAIAKEEERSSELGCLRREVADLSSILESSGVDKKAAESEIRRLKRDMEIRCCELKREKEAQAAMYEQRLNEHAVELNANALAKEVAWRKREELQTSHAKQIQVLLEENVSPPSDVEVSRGLLGEHTQKLATLDAKAGSAPPLLEERRRSTAATEVEEADILRKEVSRLSSELQALSLAKDYEASEASVALNQKAELLANAKKRQERLEAEVEQETEAAAELERQVAVGKKRIEELATELEAERSSATKAAETSAAEIVKLREHICFKESQINGQKHMKESLNGRSDKVKLDLEEKTLALARTEERVLVLEAEREDIAYMIKDIRNDKEKYVAELKRKREKTAVELKDTRDAQREAEKRCRELEKENEAMTDDYEGRLQQQALNYEEQISKAHNGGPRAEAKEEVERLQLHINEIEESRKLTARKLRDIMKKYSENEDKFISALDKERERADRLDRMLEDSRRERDADWERLHQNMDSLKEQLDVKSSTVKYLWEKVAATRREKGVGNEELKTKLDEANEVRANLEHLVEEQEEQIERLRRRAKRRDEEITQTVMSRLEAQSVEEEDCSLVDIKTERKMLMVKYRVLEQQVSDLKKLVDEITKLEHGVPEIACEASLEVLSVCSDISQESTFMPKAVEDIPEAELRELVSWFRERGLERRRLLKRYKAGRLKTEALDAKKKAGIDPFASARGQKLPLKRASGRSPNSDAGSMKSVHSTRSGVSVVSNLSLRMANAESGVENSSRRGKKPRPRDRSVSPRPLNMGVGTGRGAEACADIATSMARNKVSRSAARSDLSGSGLKSPRATTRAT